MGKLKKPRISNLPKDYKYRKWIEHSLERDSPPLNYFTFAKEFERSEQETNNHYNNLLENLSKNQSNKLIKIAFDAKTTFKRRKSNNEFGKAYKKYWKNKNLRETQKQISMQQQNALIKINELTCDTIVALAEEVNSDFVSVSTFNNPNTNDKHNGTDGESNDTDDESNDTDDESNDTDDESNGTDDGEVKTNPINKILLLAMEMPSDKVGHLCIVDFTSNSVISMLKNSLSDEEYKDIKNNLKVNDFNISDYAKQLINVFEKTLPSTNALRDSLRTCGNQAHYDQFLHSDAGFIEVTTRHFLDLIDSPRNPLLYSQKERTASIYTITYILNQLFLSNNDIIQIGWIENEYCITGKRKWDGVAFLVSDKTISTLLIEFSGGINNNNMASKEKNDITKIYKNLLTMLKTIPNNVDQHVFCARYYDNSIYFEQLHYHNNMYIRNQCASFICPTTPRLLIHYIMEIPNILKWKEAIVNQALQFQN
ncbi:unnamed protein product [Cunninghamella blakesleeana]